MATLNPRLTIKFIMFLSLPISIIIIIMFVFFHIFEKEKHLTLQLFPGILGCYRGTLGIMQLVAVNERFVALNNILKELIERKNKKDCALCVHFQLINKIKVRSEKMCYKHTIV